MKTRVILRIFAALLALAGMGAAQGRPSGTPMTLEQCLLRALEKNLGVRIQVLEPEIADFAITAAAERFLPAFAFGRTRESQISPSYSFLDAGEKYTDDYSRYFGRMDLALPTGGTLSAALSSSRSENSRSFQTINPRFNGLLSFTFSQPLLKDFGWRIPRREIIVARTRRDAAEAAYRQTVLQTLYDVEEAYWNLVFSLEDLKVKRQSLDLARDLLERNKRERAIGTLAAIEITTAESEVATREADILQAEVLARNSEDTLRTLIGVKARDADIVGPIVPTDGPAVEKRDLDVETALAQAAAGRPEIEIARLDVKGRSFDLSYARNQLLPSLSLDLSYWSPGVSGTQILYQDDNPLTGIVVGRVPGGSANAMRDALRFKYKNWSVDLTLAIPLSAVFTRAAAATARAKLEGARLKLEQAEEQVFIEVRTAVRDVETNVKRVEAYAAAKGLAAKKLDAEEKKLKAGMARNYDVVLAQRDLAAARSAELRARVDYILSVARLDRATGSSLERRNITLRR
jgi:outer membrane protein TolC